MASSCTERYTGVATRSAGVEAVAGHATQSSSVTIRHLNVRRARDLDPFPERKCGPSLLGLPVRVLKDTGVGGWKGTVS